MSAPARADASDPWWGPDKALHFGVSAGIAGGAYGLSAPLVGGYGERLAIGSGVALAAGVTKELIDLAGAGDPSWRDLTWDLIGTVVGVSVAFTLDFALRGPDPAAAQ